MPGWVPSVIPVVIALLAALIFSLSGVGRPPSPPVEVHTLDPLPTATAFLYVHVDGAVALPGVYALPASGRVFEAIAAAGGSTDDADLSLLNLAARVADGQKLVIPARRASGDDASSIAPVAPPPPAAASAPSAATINVNTATQKMLESLPGIGPVTATRIITYRNENGPFTRVEQLRESRLLNASVYERVKNLVSVD